MSSSPSNAIQETIKIALDAADIATEAANEYNRIKKDFTKSEAMVQRIYRYSFLLFVIVAIICVLFTSVLMMFYARSINQLDYLTKTNREALVVFAENVDKVNDNIVNITALENRAKSLQKKGDERDKKLTEIAESIAMTQQYFNAKISGTNVKLSETQDALVQRMDTTGTGIKESMQTVIKSVKSMDEVMNTLKRNKEDEILEAIAKLGRKQNAMEIRLEEIAKIRVSAQNAGGNGGENLPTAISNNLGVVKNAAVQKKDSGVLKYP